MLFKNGDDIYEHFKQQDRYLYQLTNKLNLKNPNENMVLANLSIY